MSRRTSLDLWDDDGVKMDIRNAVEQEFRAMNGVELLSVEAHEVNV